MADQLLGQRGPAAGEHLPPSGRAERRPGPWVRGQPRDRGREGVRVAGQHQISGHAVLHQVQWPSRGRRHHREPARGGLLQRLPERLVRPAVHEHVEAGVDGRQLVAAALAQEHRVGHLLAQRGLGRPGAHDDQPHPGQGGDPGQQLDVLFRGQAAHVTGDHLTAGRQAGPDLSAAPGWVEPGRIHSAAPQPHVGDPAAEQAGRGDRGRGQRSRGPVVDAAQPPPRDRLAGPAEPVRVGVGR